MLRCLLEVVYVCKNVTQNDRILGIFKGDIGKKKYLVWG